MLGHPFTHSSSCCYQVAEEFEMNDLLTAIIPDPDYIDGACRKEIHGETPEVLAKSAREWLLLETGYGASQVGSKFNVYRDGARVGTLMYNGKFHWADPLYAR